MSERREDAHIDPKRLFDPQRREAVLDQLNRDNLDDVGLVGGDQGMKVLQEMNDLAIEGDQSARRTSAGMKVI